MGITCSVELRLVPELIDIQKTSRYGDHKMRFILDGASGLDDYEAIMV